MLKKINSDPPYCIAIVGGGQLGKMMTVAAKQLGFKVTVLDPTPESPAGQVADYQVVAEFHDGKAIRDLASGADVITYEFEHIDSASLVELEEQGFTVFPSPQTLRIIQNKLRQKKAMAQVGIPLPAFEPVCSLEDVYRSADRLGYPLLLKACTGGYDGKGNFLVEEEKDIKDAMQYFEGKPILAEEFIPFACEISVLVARGCGGEVRSYPLSENEHAENILRRSIIPARVNESVTARARKVAEDVMTLFHGTGVFCVEMFVTRGEDVLVNEVAPRPHNSGHYTIEACPTSQFEQHIRAIAGLPLGDTALHIPAVMINLLGENGHSGPASLAGCDLALSLPGVHLHFYGKKQTRPRRKMGHVTVTAPDLAEAIRVADKATQNLRVIAMKEEG